MKKIPKELQKTLLGLTKIFGKSLDQLFEDLEKHQELYNDHLGHYELLQLICDSRQKSALKYDTYTIDLGYEHLVQELCKIGVYHFNRMLDFDKRIFLSTLQSFIRLIEVEDDAISFPRIAIPTKV